MNFSHIIRRLPFKVNAWARELFGGKKYKELASEYDFGGYKRIYLVHIRKTAGSSLNRMFLGLSGEDTAVILRRVFRNNGRTISNGLIYAAWNRKHLNKGDYFYGNSHLPLHELDLAPDTFTIASFRDPVKRVVSHYNMLRSYEIDQDPNPCMKTEGLWLGDSFGDFLDRIPKEHLLNQLYMFSKSMNVDEALDRATKLSFCVYLEKFDEGVSELASILDLPLESTRARVSAHRAEIAPAHLERLRGMLADEYDFLDKLNERRSALRN